MWGAWKGVIVPGLTFGKAVLCTGSKVQAKLEITLGNVGRIALGAHENAPNRRVQGDMGWSSFQSSQAASKINFGERPTDMKEMRRVQRS